MPDPLPLPVGEGGRRPGEGPLQRARSGEASPFSGRQYEISHGPHRAVAVELGAALRAYSVHDRDLLDGFAPDTPITGSRGMPLLPWPNRIEDGRYTFQGQTHQLPLTDPAEGHAIHGLTRWVSWSLLSHTAERVALTTTVYPQPGYPFTLELTVAYALSADGLTVETTATNRGRDPLPFGAGFHPYLAIPGGRVDTAVVHVPAERYQPFGPRWLPDPPGDVADTPFDFRQPHPVGDLALIASYAGLARDHDGLARVRVGDTTVWMDAAFRHVLLFSGDSLPDPAARRRSVAVEPMTCPPNAFRTGVDLTVLEPGQSFTSRWGIAP